MRILVALVATFALTGFAATAYADGVEKPMVQRSMPTSGKDARHICQDLRAQEIMPGTVNECVADTLSRNNLEAEDDTRSLERINVLVYAGTTADALLAAEPSAQAAPPSVSYPLTAAPERESAPMLWVLLALVALGATGYFVWKGQRPPPLSEEDTEVTAVAGEPETPVVESTPPSDEPAPEEDQSPLL